MDTTVDQHCKKHQCMDCLWTGAMSTTRLSRDEGEDKGKRTSYSQKYSSELDQPYQAERIHGSRFGNDKSIGRRTKKAVFRLPVNLDVRSTLGRVGIIRRALPPHFSDGTKDIANNNHSGDSGPWTKCTHNYSKYTETSRQQGRSLTNLSRRPTCQRGSCPGCCKPATGTNPNSSPLPRRDTRLRW